MKVIDIWNATVGEIKMHSSVDATPNAHYIPDDTTIKVGDKVYNTADMYETASRCYLLVRGYDGLDTENFGAGKIAALPGGAQAMSTTEVPPTHDTPGVPLRTTSSEPTTSPPARAPATMVPSSRSLTARRSTARSTSPSWTTR